MTSVLLIDEEAKKRAQEVVDYAENHRISIEALKNYVNSERSISEADPMYVCHFDANYRTAFTIEEHPVGWVRHLSVSVSRAGRWPLPQAVEMIMELFGMGNNLNKAYAVYKEDPAEAINVITKYNQ